MAASDSADRSTPREGSRAESEKEEFRRALSLYPTGVVAVTGSGNSGNHGLLVGSFVSVSLEPRLVGFLVDKHSTSWPSIRQLDRFSINVLGADQEDVGHQFAQSGGDKFRNVDWSGAPQSPPIITGCAAWLICTLVQEIEMGDHWFELCRVEDFGIHRETQPLVFWRRAFATVSSG